MPQITPKVGIISCSGEELPEGTISRLAARRVLEALRPQQTVTLCLPLFLAGEAGERRFAREHPTITVDGCPKLCAKRGTEQYSGQVSASLVVSDILADRAMQCHCSTRDSAKADEKAIWLVADRIAAEVDLLLASSPCVEPTEPAAAGACCSCGSPSPQGTLEVAGQPVAINALPLIFQQLRKKGLEPDDNCGDDLLKVVQIYQYVEPALERAYRDALVPAYQAYCQGKGRRP